LGLPRDAIINAPAPTHRAANRTGGGEQQSITVKVIFFVTNNGFVELVILTPFLINFSVRPLGNSKVAPVVIKFNVLPS
jgi:hypothetical protein